MKVIKTFDDKEFLVANDEAENIAGLFGSEKLIKLRCGEWLNLKSIAHISEPESIATWDGYKLSKDGSSFIRDGKRIYLEPHNYSEIKYILHPRYKAMFEQLQLSQPNAKQLESGK